MPPLQIPEGQKVRVKYYSEDSGLVAKAENDLTQEERDERFIRMKMKQCNCERWQAIAQMHC